MSLEILDQHLVNTIGGRRVAARVSHRAPTPVQILPHHHRNFPQAWIRPGGARRYHAVVEQLVVQGVGPAGRSVLVNRHGRVVREVRVPQHLEHVVPPDLFFFFYIPVLHFLPKLIDLDTKRLQDGLLPTRMGPSFLSRPPASRLHKRREFHVAPQPLEPTFAERTARRNCACFRGGGGDLSRSVDDSILEKLGHAIAGRESKKFDRSTGPPSFFFRDGGKIISKRERKRGNTKLTNVIILFGVCLFVCWLVGKPVLDPFSCILTRV